MRIETGSPFYDLMIHDSIHSGEWKVFWDGSPPGEELTVCAICDRAIGSPRDPGKSIRVTRTAQILS